MSDKPTLAKSALGQFDSSQTVESSQGPVSGFLHRNLKLGGKRDIRLAFWLLALTASGFIAYVARMHEITHDAFHEMSLFREALVLGEFPTEDVFAYTPTVSPSVHHEWATGAILYFATIGTGMGLVGLSLLKLLLMAALWLLLYRVARMRGAHPYVFALLAFITFPVLWVGFATVRAQLFTLVFIAAQLWMHEQDWRGRRLWVVLWLAMLVAWLNIHAGFVVGLGLIAFHSLERFGWSWFQKRSFLAALGDTWHLIVTAPVAVACLQLNPYGWKYIPYLVRAIGMDRPLIREWKPLWYTYAPILTLVAFAMAVLLFAYVQRTTRARRLRGGAFLALAAYMTLKHIRHGSIFGVVWIAYVPAWISRTDFGKWMVAAIDRNRAGCIRACQLSAAACLLFASFHHFWRPTLPPERLYSTACYPTGAVDYLKDHQFQGNLLTPFHVGAYVSWEMYPDVRVSFDGRYEVAYQEQVMPQHNRFLDGEEGWWKLLDEYPTDAVLVHRQAPVCELLDVFREESETLPPATRKQWEFVYEDDSFVLLAPRGSSLPYLDQRGQALNDGAWEAFSSSHAHWNRSVPVSTALRSNP